MNANSLVTVIVVTYNHRDYIEQSLSSILSQVSARPIEIIVFDDCSNDGTSEIIAQYSELYPQIKHERNAENCFGTLEYYRKIEKLFTDLPQGDLIFYLEGDDYWIDARKIEKQCAFMDCNPECSFSFHDWTKVRFDGTLMHESMPEVSRRNYTTQDLRKFNYAWILMGTLCIRRRKIRWPAGLAATLSTDMFLPFIYGGFGPGYFVTGIGPLAYRQHTTGIWASANTEIKSFHKVRTACAMLAILIASNDKKSAMNVALSRLLPALLSAGLLRTQKN